MQPNSIWRSAPMTTALLLTGFAAGLCGPDAGAQAWPAKSPRIVVPSAPGGSLDIMARATADSLGESLRRRVLVDNRPGANATLGPEHVAHSAPDGYTLLMVASPFTTTPSLMRNVPYDPVRDFAGISLVAWIPLMLVVHPSLAANNVRALIDLAKAQPGKLNYASASLGSGSHMAMALFARQAGISLARIGYNGDPPALADLVGGHVQVKFDNFTSSLPLLKQGRLRALGVTSPARFSLLPDVPAIAETLPGFEASIYNGVVAPAGTPRDILERVHAEIERFTRAPEARAKFAQQGIELQASAGPGEFNAFLKAELSRSAKLIQEAGIVPE